jgi:hypothetical protein
VPKGGKNHIAIDVIKAKIAQLINQNNWISCNIFTVY